MPGRVFTVGISTHLFVVKQRSYRPSNLSYSVLYTLTVKTVRPVQKYKYCRRDKMMGRALVEQTLPVLSILPLAEKKKHTMRRISHIISLARALIFIVGDHCYCDDDGPATSI